ncbi:MAG: GHKL domain-containing protein [Ruminococcus sp.]|nr:GHKL domain-containing protein [Ruminococcus sp.]
MLINLLFIFTFFVEMLISTLFLSSVSERKNSLPITIISGALLFEIGALINIFVVSTVWLNVLFSFVANLAFSLCFFKIKKVRAVFYSLLLVAVSTIIELITIFVISSLTETYITNYESEPIILTVEIIISKILYFLIAMLLARFADKNNQTIKTPATFYIFPIITSVAVIGFWYISLNEVIEYKNQIILAGISVLLFLATILVFFAYRFNAQRENKLLLLQQEQDKIKTDMVYYDVLEKQNDNLRIYAHDAKNHLAAIKSLNTNPQIDTYISEMIKKLSEYSNVCHSGNRIVDVIVNKYITECKINGIDFEFDIKNNNLSCIEYYDTVTILGNLLDNAVEAVSVAKEKHISFETDFRNNFSVIIISNSCDRNPLNENGDITETTKSNKRLHGFGLKSVRKTINKYNGDIAFDYDSGKGIFVVTVMIENSYK